MLALLKLTASGVGDRWIIRAVTARWCQVIDSRSSPDAQVTIHTAFFSCYVESSAAVFYSLTQSGSFVNTRVESSAVTTTGGARFMNDNADGAVGSTFVMRSAGCDGCVLDGVSDIIGCVFVGGKGLKAQSSWGKQIVRNSVIVGSSQYGVTVSGANNVELSGNRFRNNTSGAFNSISGEVLDLSNDTSPGTDADEFVDAANGDYRIKATSALWGKGIGAGDEIPTPAAIAAAVWARSGRTLTA
jgi:hypothetical protein